MPASIVAIANPVVATAVASVELNGVLANVSLVSKIVGLCGNVENVRQVAEAVQACGVGEAFQHLELIAAIRGSTGS